MKSSRRSRRKETKKTTTLESSSATTTQALQFSSPVCPDGVRPPVTVPSSLSTQSEVGMDLYVSDVWSEKKQDSHTGKINTVTSTFDHHYLIAPSFQKCPWKFTFGNCESSLISKGPTWGSGGLTSTFIRQLYTTARVSVCAIFDLLSCRHVRRHI